jgi:hypothetical protein
VQRGNAAAPVETADIDIGEDKIPRLVIARQIRPAAQVLPEGGRVGAVAGKVAAALASLGIHGIEQLAAADIRQLRLQPGVEQLLRLPAFCAARRQRPHALREQRFQPQPVPANNAAEGILFRGRCGRRVVLFHQSNR